VKFSTCTFQFHGNGVSLSTGGTAVRPVAS
jgi:hypothetical protein